MSYKLVIRKESALQLLLLALSCVSSAFVYLYFAIVFFEIRKGSAGFIKMCVLFTIRQVLYLPGVIVPVNGSQIYFKLVLYLIAAFIEILRDRYATKESFFVLVFGMSAEISALAFSSYPVSASIKVISFTIVFYAICQAVTRCDGVFDVPDYLYRVLSIVMIISFLLLPVGRAYMSSSVGRIFDGLMNHANDFGVICSIYIALILTRFEKIRIKEVVLIFGSLIMIYMSRSRGAMLAALIILLGYYFLSKDAKYKKFVGALCIAVLFSYAFIPKFRLAVVNYYNKNGSQASEFSSDAFTLSRAEIVQVAIMRFKSSPLFGRGLLTTYVPGVRSMSPFDSGTEPGNIVLELLGGVGLIGFVLFFVMILLFFIRAPRRYKLLTIAAVATSLSEVSFFSINNYAALYYILIACSTLSYEYIDPLYDNVYKT